LGFPALFIEVCVVEVLASRFRASSFFNITDSIIMTWCISSNFYTRHWVARAYARRVWGWG